MYKTAAEYKKQHGSYLILLIQYPNLHIPFSETDISPIFLFYTVCSTSKPDSVHLLYTFLYHLSALIWQTRLHNFSFFDTISFLHHKPLHRNCFSLPFIHRLIHISFLPVICISKTNILAHRNGNSKIPCRPKSLIHFMNDHTLSG
ncbi:hypothetical protein C823_007479 [Eubacterium plexicaudatum ASF492]|nr:hypothetical protein C823_007479 [Eubacterium plexicaudatum ASF492]